MTTNEFPTDLLNILACPLTKTPLIYNKEKNELLSVKAKLAYPIRDGIAVMLIDEARIVEDDELANFN